MSTTSRNIYKNPKNAGSVETTHSFIRQMVSLYEKDSSTFTIKDLVAFFADQGYTKIQIMGWLSMWSRKAWVSEDYRELMGSRVLVRVKNGVYKFVDNEAAAREFKQHGKKTASVQPAVKQLCNNSRTMFGETVVCKRWAGHTKDYHSDGQTNWSAEPEKPAPKPGTAKTVWCVKCQKTVAITGHNCVPVQPETMTPIQMPEKPMNAPLPPVTPVVTPGSAPVSTSAPRVTLPPVTRPSLVAAAAEQVNNPVVEVLHTEVAAAKIGQAAEITYLLRINGVLYRTQPFKLL